MSFVSVTVKRPREEEKCTSPRRTWVIPISWSSTTDAKWYVGNKSVFKRIGSVAKDRCASFSWPKTRSTAGGLMGRLLSCTFVRMTEVVIEPSVTDV